MIISQFTSTCRPLNLNNAPALDAKLLTTLISVTDIAF